VVVAAVEAAAIATGVSPGRSASRFRIPQKCSFLPIPAVNEPAVAYAPPCTLSRSKSQQPA
jgi:hypothetical protein